MSLSLVATPHKTSRIGPPKLRAVVQVYREGLELIDGDGREVGHPFRRYGKDAELSPGPGVSFAVVSGSSVATYEGPKLLSIVPFHGFTEVVGWAGKWPIVQSDNKTYQVTKGQATRLPAKLTNSDQIAGDGAGNYVCASAFYKGEDSWVEYLVFALENGDQKTLLPKLGISAGAVAYAGNRAFLATHANFRSIESPQDSGSLSVLDLKNGTTKTLTQRTNTAWNITQPDELGRYWVTESGYFVAVRKKFFDWHRVYKFTQAKGLERLGYMKGDYLAYGVDKTDRYLIGHHVYGFEMGAYDLVATDLRNFKEEPICHGVEEYKRIE